MILRLIVLKDFFKWSFQKEEPASSLAGRLLLDEVEGGIITRYQILEHPERSQSYGKQWNIPVDGSEAIGGVQASRAELPA